MHTYYVLDIVCVSTIVFFYITIMSSLPSQRTMKYFYAFTNWPYGRLCSVGGLIAFYFFVSSTFIG